jgi:hypothetical protein
MESSSRIGKTVKKDYLNPNEIHRFTNLQHNSALRLMEAQGPQNKTISVFPDKEIQRILRLEKTTLKLKQMGRYTN